jgi:hypothetical protein
LDLEEMTHFAAYENNDGFPATPRRWKFPLQPPAPLPSGPAARGSTTAGKRHAFTLAPELTLGHHCSAFAGVQFLRGDRENDLFVLGFSMKL